MGDDGQLSLELPGIDMSDRENDTAMVRAMRATLRVLRDEARLRPSDAAMVQLSLSLSGAIDAGTRSGRASAVAMAARELRETLLTLDPPPEDVTADAGSKAQLAQLLAALDLAARNGGQLPPTVLGELSDGS